MKENNNYSKVHGRQGPSGSSINVIRHERKLAHNMALTFSELPLNSQRRQTRGDFYSYYSTLFSLAIRSNGYFSSLSIGPLTSRWTMVNVNGHHVFSSFTFVLQIHSFWNKVETLGDDNVLCASRSLGPIFLFKKKQTVCSFTSGER